MGFIENMVNKKLDKIKKVRRTGVSVVMINSDHSLDLDDIESVKAIDRIVTAINEDKKTVEFGTRVLVVNKIVSINLYDYEEEEEIDY